MSTQAQTNTNATPTAAAMDELIRSLSPDACWLAGPPLPEAQAEEWLAQVPAARRNLPADLRQLYRHTDDAEIGPNIFLLPLAEIVEKYEDLYGVFLDAGMPSMFLLAVNNASRAFFCDTDSSLGHGVGAIYIGDVSGIGPETCILCAPSMTDFLRLTTAELKPWEDEVRY